MRPLRLGEEKKNKKKETTGKNMMSASATQGGHNYGAALAAGTDQRPLKFLERIVTVTVKCAFFLGYR